MSEKSKTIHKKSKLAFLIRFFVLLGLVITIVFAFLFIFSPDIIDPYTREKPDGLPAAQNISLFSKLFLLTISISHYLILSVGLFAVAKILDLYVSGKWFLPNFGKYLKTFGISLIAYTLFTGVAKILYSTIIIYEIKQNRIPEYIEIPGLKMSIPSDNNVFLILLIGFLLVIISRVHKKAVENAVDLEKIV